jgi:hypothetical protein
MAVLRHYHGPSWILESRTLKIGQNYGIVSAEINRNFTTNLLRHANRLRPSPFFYTISILPLELSSLRIEKFPYAFSDSAQTFPRHFQGWFSNGSQTAPRQFPESDGKVTGKCPELAEFKFRSLK